MTPAEKSDKPYYPSDRPGSFISRHIRLKSDVSSPRTPDLSSVAEVQQPIIDDFVAENFDELVQDHNIEQVTEEIDRFTDTLSAVDDKTNPPDVPDTVDTFSKIVEARIAKYYSGDNHSRFGKMTEEDSFFLQAVNRISKLTDAFSDFPSASATTTSLNRTSMALQRAMSFLEEELRDLLEGSRSKRFSSPVENNIKSTSTLSSSKNLLSINSRHDTSFTDLTINEDAEEEVFPGYSNDVVTKMTRIVSTMISAGYESECCQVYSISRRNAFEEVLRSLEIEKMSIDDVQKMQWDTLEIEIGKWIKAVKQCATVLFPGERKLSESVFPDHPTISDSLFGNLARAVIIQLLNFADAVALTKRSAEKLFKFLDMYETLRELTAVVEGSGSSSEAKVEITAAGDRLGEAAVCIFGDLESSIKGDLARTPLPGGAVHPLTRYVMNYLKYTCEYKETLNHVFLSKEQSKLSPFAFQLMTIVELLDESLDGKSKLYKDTSLRFVFLMNNGRYILQKIKGSTEILEVMGDTWYRTRSTIVRQYHKNYQRETWGKLLQCLSQEGLLQGGNGKVQKQVLKDRFKSFNTMMEEIHRTQSGWVVNEEQLKSELRVSITAVVIPAYRAFFGRFKHYLESSRQADKFIKYQPEDIESMIEDLFEGNAVSMARRRT
ncbi:exocyst complex component EXO70B1-like [Impatiens glandulifera]|uniref:exocyst complex component EXO70B1-like n=1 Tax=Impatiens glandulifera TaxID=253017 RepID=UPI001FB16E16|nr:exocyst complex component EXO70B1-like [Impatiens glandulifera]